MKKVLAMILLLSCLFTLYSCGDDENGTDSGMLQYYQYGLGFRLPENFELKKLQDIDASYSDGNLWFVLNAFDENEMLGTLRLPSADMTVKEYTEYFLIQNPYTKDYEYDEERNASTFNYVYDYGTDKRENEYFSYLITRSKENLYVVIVYCDEKDFEKYSSVFDEIINSIIVL